MPELKPLPCPACGETDILLLNSAEMGIHYVCRCGCAGPFAETQKTAITAWDSLPRALTWTTEPPRVEGRYFLREAWASGKWRNHGVVRVFFDKDSQKLQLRGWGRTSDGVSNFGHYADTKAPQWAGPIPEPLEPDEGGV